MDPILLIEASDATNEPFQNSFSELRALHQDLVKAEAENVRVAVAWKMQGLTLAMANTLRLSGLPAAARFSDTLETLLTDLAEKPRNLNPDSLRSVAQAIDFLNVLCNAGKAANKCDPALGSILVVDDEPISRRAITASLGKAGLQSTCLHDPAIALTLLQENAFDMVVLDVHMPEMNGFELCSAMRALPGHKHTPVIFVTGLNSLECRAASMISGGNEMTIKPFLYAELALKALLHIMRARLTRD